MGQLAVDLVSWTRVAVLLAFTALAVTALVRARDSGAAGRWVAAAFGAISVGLLIGWVPGELGVELPAWAEPVRILLILSFPYLILRFAGSFAPFPRWLEAAAAVGVVIVAVATVTVPGLGGQGATRPPWFGAYVALVLTYWVLLSAVSSVRLWRAGRDQPTVARRRMRLMSAAVAVLAVALLLAGRIPDPALRLTVNVVALASAAIFWLGFSPPRALRLSWRRPEEDELRAGTMAILEATSHEEVAEALLRPTVRLVGGGGAALVDGRGKVMATHGQAPTQGAHVDLAAPVGPEGRPGEVLSLGEDRAHLVVWTNAYAPFFGREEAELLASMGAVATLALERVDLLAEERAGRAVIEEAQRQAEQAREEATKANAAKTEFLARMSHELRTPLNAILGFGQLLEVSDGLSEADREGVKYILKGGHHLLDLINEVLDLAGIESGMLTLSLEPVHAGDLIDDTLAMVRPLAANRSIHVSARTGSCDAHVMTDRQRSRQVLLNLLSNAVKYNRDGGEVGVFCTRVADETLRISVADTGPGIDEARRARLFDPFDRLGAENTAVEGTGLGLALSKQLMERLGGAIGVDTAPGQGSTFWIDLPITQAPLDVTEPRPQVSPPVEQAPRTLLLVEDNLANLMVVEAMLRQRPGIEVMPAMQGRMALDLAYEHRPDVIVLDLHLPDLTGRQVLHRLRADPRTRDIPVLIASADASPRRMSQLHDEGAFGYLSKPLDLQKFLAAVDAALAHRSDG